MRSAQTLMRLAALLVACACGCVALPKYSNQLPNGNAVASPCDPAQAWPGVGHYSQAGGGPRNPFGVDFKAENYKWTQQLCRKDSDGDGQTNGQELGDPNCVWQVGATPSRTTGITHPGICEPVGSDRCAGKNADLKCPEKFVCPAIQQAGVRRMTMRMNRTVVPPKETTYMCQAYEVSTQQKEHMIAAVPVIDNPSVLHHMLVYGCATKPNVKLNEPFECGMGAANCISLVELWGLGMRPGNCYRDNVGAPFGLQGYQYVVMQLHWNNPAGVVGMQDGSGFELYFSPALRTFDTGVMMYGQVNLDLAPRQTEIHRTATCDSRCTAALLPPTGYKLLWGTLHMHLHGTRGEVTLWRGGQKVRDLIPMHKFDYDTPMVFEYSQPIDYLPGDEIKTDCYYNTMKTNRSVYWGESTQEEMCYGFFQYYPHNRTKSLVWPNPDMCSAFGKIDYCTLSLNNADPYIIDNCNVKDIPTGRLFAKHRPQVQTECHQNQMYRCSDQCLAWYRKVKASEPCFSGDMLDYVHFYRSAATDVVTYLDMCALRDQLELKKDAEKRIDELNRRPPPPPTTNSELLTFDTRLLIVSGAYLAGLLIAVVLVLVALNLKNRSSRVCAEDGSKSSRM